MRHQPKVSASTPPGYLTGGFRSHVIVSRTCLCDSKEMAEPYLRIASCPRTQATRFVKILQIIGFSAIEEDDQMRENWALAFIPNRRSSNLCNLCYFMLYLSKGVVKNNYASRPIEGIFEAYTSCPAMAPIQETPIQVTTVNNRPNRSPASMLGVMDT